MNARSHHGAREARHPDPWSRRRLQGARCAGRCCPSDERGLRGRHRAKAHGQVRVRLRSFRAVSEGLSSRRLRRCGGASRPRIPRAQSRSTAILHWAHQDGVFRLLRASVHFKTREQAYEGKYVIQNREQTCPPSMPCCLYKNWLDVSAPSRRLKYGSTFGRSSTPIDTAAKAHIYVVPPLAFLQSPPIEKSQGRPPRSFPPPKP